MDQEQNLNATLMAEVRKCMGERMNEFYLPPPAYVTMRAEVLEIDLEAGRLKVKFPVLEEYLNPYGSMQGGLVAAAVDNTFGPLGMLVAPPNVTRKLEIKYSRQITLEMIEFTVEAVFKGREGRMLAFSADVRDMDGALLARSRATHWIVD